MLTFIDEQIATFFTEQHLDTRNKEKLTRSMDIILSDFEDMWTVRGVVRGNE